MTTLLRLDNVGRRFGGVIALHDLTLDIAAGARHAVIGPNGAGKSTLINVIAGSVGATSGAILLDGHDITRLPAAVRARRGIGRTFQHPAVFGRLTVTANLTLALHPRSTAATRRRWGGVASEVAQLVDSAGLTEHANVLAARLPYGLQRRLELAMALATAPRLLLLDEPSAGLDPDEITDFSRLIHELGDETTVLLVDHNLDLIWDVATTVTVLHHGRQLATGIQDQIRADPLVRDAYLTTSDPLPTRNPTAQAAGPNLLRIRNLRAGYHGAPVLHGIDLDVHDGEAVAILGRNGAGKTTLLNTLAGLLPATPHSRVELAGMSLSNLRPHHRSRLGIALVPQGRRLFGPLTVAEHLIAAQPTHRGATPATPGQTWTIDQVLTLLPPLAARIHHRATQLSGGEQQMLALARALLTNPRLLLLDEPSEGLAPTIIDNLTTTLASLVAQGTAIVIAEQNYALATAISHRVVVLDRGHIAMTCPNTDLSTSTIRQHLGTLLGISAATVATDRGESR